MTLTEEQREAIRAVSDLPRAIGCQLCHPYIMKNYGSHFIVLRAMIDSSGTVEPTGGFDLERARGIRDFLQDDCAEVGDVWGEMIAEIERLRAENLELQVAMFGPDGIRANQACIIADQAASISELEIEITELKADLEQSERVIEARLDVIDQQAARIQELGGMLSIRTEELEIAHSCARSEREMHEKELVVFARKIAELEDALVEGLTNFLHYRASCYDPARRCPYAKECDDCSTWDACGHVEKFRSEARQQLQAEGKIGPDATKPRSWQITDERKAAIDRGLQFLEWSYAKNSAHDTKEQIAVLWAMLEASQ